MQPTVLVVRADFLGAKRHTATRRHTASWPHGPRSPQGPHAHAAMGQCARAVRVAAAQRRQVGMLLGMITAVHALVYADDPEAARRFFRDVLGLPFVDAHGGWLIFKTGRSELGVHPTSGGEESATWSVAEHHEISFICDDIERTVAELAARGAEFSGGITDVSFGRRASVKVPGGGEMLLYQPNHKTAYDL